MPRILKIEEDGFKYDVFYHSKFQEGLGNLDYLHIVRQPSYLKFPWCQVRTLKELKEKYENYILGACKDLLEFYQKSERSIFEPGGFVRPKTTRPELQDPIINAFLEAFPSMVNLSEGAKDSIDLNKDILIIDDVYAKGDTSRREISRFEAERNCIIICPLYVDQFHAKLTSIFHNLKPEAT